MKRFLLTLLAALLIGSLAACAQKPAPAGDPTATPDPVFAEITPLAVDLVAQASAGNYQAATAHFNAGMLEAIPPDKLKETWEAVIDQAGPFQKIIGARSSVYKDYRLIFVTCQFEKDTRDVRVVFNRLKQVAGLFFDPGQPELATPQP